MGKKKKGAECKEKNLAGNHSYINRKYKNSLFRMLFSDREALLSLYNAVNQTAYKDPSALEIMTIDGRHLCGNKNDLAFLIDCRLNLYEAQSTRNPNMPLRGVFYFSQVYQGYVNRNGLNIFSEKQIRLPVPPLSWYCITVQKRNRTARSCGCRMPLIIRKKPAWNVQR